MKIASPRGFSYYNSSERARFNPKRFTYSPNS
jgi:hypothetical protein